MRRRVAWLAAAGGLALLVAAAGLSHDRAQQRAALERVALAAVAAERGATGATPREVVDVDVLESSWTVLVQLDASELAEVRLHSARGLAFFPFGNRDADFTVDAVFFHAER